MAAANPFPNMMQMQPRVPIPVWIGIRFITIFLAVLLIVTTFVWPDWGLRIFWKIFVPVFPLLIFIAPGLWRNICPLAATHQLPRLFKFTRGLTLPDVVIDNAYLVAIGLFLAIVPLRYAYLNESGLALGILLIGVFSLAFTGGFLMKGKSGWCAQFCPMLPIERIYGQTPFILVRNSHCSPCVGCTKNCFDFNPRVAYLADMNDNDQRWGSQRRLFIGFLPGLIFSFFYNPAERFDVPWYEIYGLLFLPAMVSLGIFYIADIVLRVNTHKITSVFAAGALNLFYWFAFPPLLGQIGDGLNQFSWPTAVVDSGEEISTASRWALQVVLGLLSVLWLRRSLTKEKRFVEQLMPESVQASGQLLQLHQQVKQERAEVTFAPQQLVCLATPGRTLLEVAEANDVSLPSGCRMGMCGSDPVFVADGFDNLTLATEDEQDTLRRLGLSRSWRMACCARVKGPVTISQEAGEDGAAEETTPEAPPFEVDTSIENVVVIGNGVAGATAADDVRRYHPDCNITMVAREPYQFYNRMAVSKLIYEGTDLEHITLLPPTWAQEKRIDLLVGSEALSIDPERRVVVTDRGRYLPYDRLLLTAGSSCFVPPIEGWGLPGSFTLRDIDDAIGMRDYARHNDCKDAVVLGGGLLGLEAGHALGRLGLRVTVLDRNPWILNRQLDQEGGALLLQILHELHMDVILKAEGTRIIGESRVEGVELKDGRELKCDLLLVSAGVRPELKLAQEAGLEVGRGVVADDEMRTSDPAIYAAGDLAEHRGVVYGIWPASVEQAKVAAANAMGDHRVYQGTIPVTQLKVVGVDLFSVGDFNGSEGDEVIQLIEVEDRRYRKLVVSEGRVKGAILLGYSQETTAITRAAKDGTDVTPFLEDLRAGRWDVLPV